MSFVLDFRVEISGQQYRAASYKLDGNDCYCWDWLNSMKGFLAHWDLLDGGKQRVFKNVKDVHASCHADGRSHCVIAGLEFQSESSKRAYVTKRQGSPIADITTWRSWRGTPVALNAVSHSLECGPTSRTPIILRATDFKCSGLNLNSYFCRPTALEDLCRNQHGQRHWKAGNGEIQLIVFAEPLP